MQLEKLPRGTYRVSKTTTLLVAHAEMTDTFGGEPNYTWVKRILNITAKTEREIIRKVKSKFGLTGVKCKKIDECGNTITLKPQNMNIVVFINF